MTIVTLFLLAVAITLWWASVPGRRLFAIETSKDESGLDRIRIKRRLVQLKKLLLRLVESLFHFSLVAFTLLNRFFRAVSAVVLISAIAIFGLHLLGDGRTILGSLVLGALAVALVLRLWLSLASGGKDVLRSDDFEILPGDTLALPGAYTRKLWPWSVEFKGEASAPRRVYVGDSQDIFVELHRKYTRDRGVRPLEITRTDTGATIRLQASDDHKGTLEIELLAAALVIAGDTKQQCPLSRDKLSYRWNCYFPNSGRHTVTLVIRILGKSGNAELGTLPNSIWVVKIGSLTQRQVWLLACLSGGASAVLGIIKVLQELAIP